MLLPGAITISINLCTVTDYDSFIDVLDQSGNCISYNDDYCTDKNASNEFTAEPILTRLITTCL